MHIVQLIHPERGRKLALVMEPYLQLMQSFTSVYDLAQRAVSNDGSISSLIKKNLTDEQLGYDEIYEGRSDWKLLPPFDHPSGPLHCMISGTGLTHKASAANRQDMHKATEEQTLTDSMKMYQWGLEGGHPPAGKPGVQPEWFYKGNGSLLKAHGEHLTVPTYANDGGEEPEIAGIYIIDGKGIPWRIGFTTANEFSDHVMEKKNYLYLAPSKIRECSIGPELNISADFKGITGKVSVYRTGKVLWQKTISSGEKNMAHSLANLEYHHFKYDNHRLPGQAHVHFYGADAFSFGEQVHLEDGDVMEVYWEGMGRALKNKLRVMDQEEEWVEVKEVE